jgi:hypothetical protein
MKGMDIAIDKAKEVGKPVFLNVTGSFASSSGDIPAQTAAAIAILFYVAGRCAKIGARLIVGYTYPDILPLVQHTVEQAYKAEGKVFDADDLRYMTSDSFLSVGVIMGTCATEDVRAIIDLGGGVANEAVALADLNKDHGRNCICIEGTSTQSHIQEVAICPDYNLIGSENYAAQAKITQEKTVLASIRCEDIGKILAIVLIPALYIAMQLGVKF